MTKEGPIVNKKIRSPIHFATLLLLLVSCANQVAGKPDPIAEPAAISLKQVRNIRYRILPGDEIEIKLSYHPQFNERIQVLPDGWISLPIVNSVKAAGKEPGELAKELEAAYARELKDPEVVVIVRRSSGRLAYIGGEVRAPKAVPLTFPVTLLQAVIQCGDVLPSAHEDNVLVVRTVPGAVPQALVIDMKAIRAGKAPDLPLEPYDVIHVPKTAIAEVGDFIEAYINRIIPKSVSFPFFYELHSDSNWR